MTDAALNLDLLHDPRPLLTPPEAADLLRVSEKALALWRRTGDGPAFVRLGRSVIRYRRLDLLSYVDGRVASSTASEHMRSRAH